ncbi:CBS domain protein [Trinickia symbiotica]|nr:CBS domain protein [Trinickia symbiotica]
MRWTVLNEMEQETEVNVNEIFTRGTVHVAASCTLQQAASQMGDQHVGALVVTEDGVSNRIVGIVTDRDIVIKATASGASPREMLVTDIMSEHVMTVSEDADVGDAMQIMSSHGVRRLAVTNDNEDIVGVLSLDDVIEALSREWSQLSSIIRYGQHREWSGAIQSPLHL